MQVILKDVMLMEKEIKQGNDSSLIYCFNCYQKGYKNIIQVKEIPFDLYESTKEGTHLDLECKLTSWAQGNKNGISVKYIGVGTDARATTK